MGGGGYLKLSKMLLGGQIKYFHSITSYYSAFGIEEEVESILNILTIYKNH